MAQQQTVFVLERLNWRWVTDTSLARLPGKTAAWRFRDQLEAVARQEVNPFLYCNRDLSGATILRERSFAESVRSLGLSPPEYQPVDWSYSWQHDWPGWWEKVVGTLDAAQRKTIWALLDGLRFYEVVQVGLEQ